MEEYNGQRAKWFIGEFLVQKMKKAQQNCLEIAENEIYKKQDGIGDFAEKWKFSKPSFTPSFAAA